MMIKLLLGALVGLVGGISSGLFGIGGGVVMVPAFVYFFGVDVKRAVGTSLLIIVPTAIMGASRYVVTSTVDWRLFLMVVAFAVLGGFLGPAINQRLDNELLARLFGVFLILVGIELIVLGPLNQLSAR